VPCPCCATTATAAEPRRTALGYHVFRCRRCRRCRRICNERTGTSFNHLHVPTDVVLLVVLWRRRYQRSRRDLAEMFLTRGFVFTHETVRDWEARFGPLLADHLRAKRRGTAGAKWHADETYLRVDGRRCYRYRATDRDGNRGDALLSEQRDMAAARRFFARALGRASRAPEQVTTDGHDAYPRAIRETLGPEVQHRTSRYKNNRLEQDHRAIKQRYYPMRGFGDFASVPASVPVSRNSAGISAPPGGAASTSPSRVGGASSRVAGRPSWPNWPPPDGGESPVRATRATPWTRSSSQF